MRILFHGRLSCNAAAQSRRKIDDYELLSRWPKWADASSWRAVHSLTQNASSSLRNGKPQLMFIARSSRYTKLKLLIQLDCKGLLKIVSTYRLVCTVRVA